MTTEKSHFREVAQIPKAIQSVEKLTPAGLRKMLAKRPLAAAPKELQQEVWRVWACHQHLFPSPLPIASAVGIWCREYGLHVKDAKGILKSFVSPELMAGFRFHADLMTEFATQAKEAIHRRKTMANRKPKIENGAVKDVAATIGGMPE